MVTYWVEAATRLNMDKIRSVYRKEQAQLIELYEARHGEQPLVLSNMNTKTLITMMRVLSERNTTDSNTLELMEVACRNIVKDNDDSVSGSNYEPSKDSNAEESSEDEEEEDSTKTPSSAAKLPSPSAKSAPAKRQNQPTKDTSSEDEEEESAKTPSPAKR